MLLIHMLHDVGTKEKVNMPFKKSCTDNGDNDGSSSYLDRNDKHLLLAKMKEHIYLICHISLTDKELCTWFQLLSLCEFYRFILWVLTNERN
mmetsp:Transcript_27041/g.40433  ORF Transcript_27041/g.40433 Transcript_27041/m.40433 type:complete len:92 (+) Transcript_27041:220-495(+)